MPSSATIPATAIWFSATADAVVGFASHWSCIADTSGSSRSAHVCDACAVWATNGKIFSPAGDLSIQKIWICFIPGWNGLAAIFMRGTSPRIHTT
jgi:hypothetical protein